MQKVFELFKLTPLKIGLILTLLVVTLIRFDPGIIEILELQLLDQRHRARGELTPGPEVVIVAIDEKSQDMLGRWPWPRSRLATLVNNLTEAGVMTIGFDMVFSEKDENIQGGLEAGKTSDELFAEAMKNSECTVLGFFFHDFIEDIKHLSSDEIRRDLDQIKPFKYREVKTHKGSAIKNIDNAPAVESNLPLFTHSIVSAGYFNMILDPDGVTRRYPMIMKAGGDYYAPLVLHVIANSLDGTLPSIESKEAETIIHVGGTSFPVDDNNRFMINYYGKAKTFPHISASDIILGNFDPDAIESRIVLVGATGKAMHDIRATPFDKVYPGVEINATIIDNIIQGNFLVRPQGYHFYNYLTVIILGVFMTLVLVKLSAGGGLLLSIFLLVSYYYFNQELFNRGFLINLIYPSFQIMGVYLAITSHNYFRESAQKKFIRGAFGQFLSPAVVQELVDNPSLLKLGGNQARLTAFFSDVAGFSSISETLTPQQLVELLNEYLTAMTDIILKHEGTIDKYEGDAIIAFWGAPIHHPDHAVRACLASMEMQEKLVDMRKQWKKQGRAELTVRMGLNTGLMVVGNMGSALRMDYTMMGDAVNLASRLEGVNKVYGTDIMISQFTYEDIKDHFEVRQLDMIRVVGKSEPVSIYELLAKKGELSNERQKVNKIYSNGLAAYREQKWEDARNLFQQVMTWDPDDAPSIIFMKRCEQFIFSFQDGRRLTDKELLPGPDWDGVFKMTSK